MITINAYKTSDGRLFESPEKAREHEKTGILLERIATFEETLCDGKYDTKALIVAWEQFNAKDFLDKRIGVLAFDVRTLNCLAAENITTIRELIGWTANELLKTPNLGRKSLNMIIEQLELHNLTLKK